MGIVIRQSAWATFFTYMGVGIGYVNILILFPKYMSPEQVGLTRIIQDAAMLMVPLAQLGVAQLTLRYFPRYKDKETYSTFISLVIGLTVLTLLLFSAFFLLLRFQIGSFFANQSPQVISYLGIVLLLIWILSVHQVMVSLSRSALNIVLPNFLKEVWLRALTFIALLLFAANLINFDQFIFILVGAYGANLLILITYLASNKVLQLTFRLSISKKDFVPMIRYALITFLGASGILIIGKVDSLMVTTMLGLEENAIYTTAFYIAVLIELPKRAVSQIGTPLISRSFQEDKLADVEAIYSKSALNNQVIGLLIFIGLWINLDSLYMLIPRSEIYSLGSLVVLIVGTGKLIDMSAGLNGEIIVMSKYYRVNVLLIVMLAIVTITANYLLIPYYGLIGAAIGSAIALALFNLSKMVFLWRRLKVQPFSRSTLISLGTGIITLLLGLYLPRLGNVYADILYRSLLVSIFYSGLIYFLKVSPEINDLINKAIALRKR